MATEVATAFVTLLPSTRGFGSRLNRQLSGEVDSSGRSAGRRFGGVFAATAGIAGAVGIGALIKGSVDLEAQFSKTMNVLQATTDASSAKMSKLSDLAMQMGADTVFSAKDAADAMLELARGGIAPAQIQAGALQGTLTLAAAGELQMGDAANIAVQAMGAFNLHGKDMNSIAAALAGGANASSASVHDMAEALSQAGTSAHAAGLTVQETTAALAAFSNAGIKGSDAGTSLKTFLQRLVPQTNKAQDAMVGLGLASENAAVAQKVFREEGIKGFTAFGDGEAVLERLQQHFAQALGLPATSEAVRKAANDFSWTSGIMDSAFTDSHGNFEDLATISGALQKSLKGLSDEERTTALNTLFGSDAIRAANVLGAQGEKGIRRLTKATSDQGAAQKQANANMKGTAGALESFKGSVQNVQLQLGLLIAPAVQAGLHLLTDLLNGIGPALEAVSRVLGPVADAFGTLFGGADAAGFAQTLDKVFGNTGKLVGPLTQVGGVILDLTHGFAAFKAGFKTGDIVDSGLLGFFEQLGASVRQVLPVLGRLGAALIPALVGVAGAIAPLIPAVLRLGASLIPVFGKIAGAVTKLLPAVTKFARQLGANLVVVLGTLSDLVTTKVLPAVTKMLPTFISLGKGILQTATAIEGFIVALLPTLSKVIGEIVDNLVPAVQTIGTALTTQLLPAFRRLLPVLVPVAKFLLEMFGGAIIGVIQGFAQAVKGAVGIVAGVINLVIDLIHGDWSKVWDDFKQIVVGVLNLVLGAFKVWWNAGILSIFRKGAAFLLKDIWAGLWQGLKKLASRGLEAAGNLVKDGLGAILKLFVSGAKSYLGLWGRLFTFLRSIAANAFGVLRSAFGGFAAAVKTIVGDLIGGVKSVFKGGLDFVVNAVKALPGRITALGGQFLKAGKSIINSFIDGLKGAGGVVSDIAGNVWTAVRVLLNDAVSKINAALEFKISLPFGKSVSINPPDIPALASGTRNFPGGLALVGEAGPELVVLPRRSQVIPNRVAFAGAAAAKDKATAPGNQFIHNGNIVAPDPREYVRWNQRRARAAAGGGVSF